MDSITGSGVSFAIAGCMLLGLIAAGCQNIGPVVDDSTHSTPMALPTHIDCAGVVLVRLPNAQRMIGTNNSRAQRREGPQRWFSLDYPLYMGRTEVTREQYSRVMELPQPKTSAARFPADVSWNDAVRFCGQLERRLSQQTGKSWRVRLPRESEWEYAACYGRPQREDWWPSSAHSPEYDPGITDWYDDNSGGRLHEVATKPANPAGLHDMLGNATEWCDGWYAISVNSVVPGEGTECSADGPRPIRGGHIFSTDEDCRPSRRMGGGADGGASGFRVVAEPLGWTVVKGDASGNRVERGRK